MLFEKFMRAIEQVRNANQEIVKLLNGNLDQLTDEEKLLLMIEFESLQNIIGKADSNNNLLN